MAGFVTSSTRARVPFPLGMHLFNAIGLTSSEVIVRENSPLVAALIHSAESMESAGKYANAALLFNEAHARVTGDTVTANQTELRVYENVGRALNVSNPIRCDPLQQKYVITPSMIEAIRDYQKEHPTMEGRGILGYSTLRSLADIELGPFLAEE